MSPQHILSATPPLVTFSFLVTEAIVHHHCSYEMVTVTIHHYKLLLVTDLECHHNTYTFGDATFGDIQFFGVTKAIFCHQCSYEMVTVTIRHYKSLLVSDLECHHNTYTFGDATFGDVKFFVMKALLTLTNELMVTIFAPHQCAFSCSVPCVFV